MAKISKNEKYGSDVVEIVDKFYNALKESNKLDVNIKIIPKPWYVDMKAVKEEYKDKWFNVLSKFIKYLVKYTPDEDVNHKLGGILTPKDVRDSKITFNKIDDRIDNEGSFRPFNPEFIDHKPVKKVEKIEKSNCDGKTTIRMIYCYELNKPLTYEDALKHIDLFTNNSCYLTQLDGYHSREKSEAEISFYKELYSKKVDK